MNINYLLDIRPGLQTTQQRDSLLGLGQFLSIIGHNQWELRNAIDDMAFRLNQSWHTRSSDSGNQSVTALVHVNLAVPSAPWLGWGEHATSTTHVTEGTLTGTVGTATTNTSAKMKRNHDK